MQILRAPKPYVRNEVEEDAENMYIFTDNTDRNSGKQPINNDSWYAKKYGMGLHHPTMTTALIRGLNNAYPITTQRYYNSLYKGITGRWHDKDLKEFMKVIDDDFEEILKNAHKFKNIIFPGIFNSKISKISKERTPLLYHFLMDKCLWLARELNAKI